MPTECMADTDSDIDMDMDYDSHEHLYPEHIADMLLRSEAPDY